MLRRDFIRLASAAGTGLALANPLSRAAAQPLPEHPNVLFIIFDDLNDWIGCLGGHPDTMTPNLDAFAQSGVLFSNAHACSPACNPSRTAIYTGLRPSTSGIYFNHQWFGHRLGDDYPTMPDRLQQAGYTNLLVGKFYHSMIDTQAWDYIFPVFDYHEMVGLDPYLPHHPHNGLNEPFEGVSGNDFFWGPTDEKEALMQDVRRSKFISNRFSSGIPEPFFLAFGTHSPHYPDTPPRRYLERFNLAEIDLPPYLENDLNDIPPIGLSWVHPAEQSEVIGHKAWAEAVRAYIATVNYVDEQVGRVLEALNNSPYASNTIVIITSDHGHHLGEKHHWRKWTLWEESLHVPLIVRVPGLTPPGTICTHAASLLDIYPTLIDLCHLNAVDGIEGLSLRPQLYDPSLPFNRPAISSHSLGNHCVRSDRFRYIQYQDGAEELYDHEFDPNEWTNLADDPNYAEIKAQLALWIPGGGGGQAQ